MRRLLLISLATIPLAGCQFFNRDSDTVVDVIESVESGEALEAIPNKIENIAANDAETDGAAEEDSAAFDDPTIEGQEAENTDIVTADLIQSTDPEARLKAATLSRVDPFATLVPPIGDPIILTPIPDPETTVASSNSGGNAARNASSNATDRETPEPTPPPVRVQPPNEPLVVPSVATLPPIPQPVIAPTILVSGVIQLGSEPYAIVRSGNEPERYVRVGDRLAGGSVRVKRIETLAFEPRVILEENGIEVPRPVVSGSDSEEDDGPVAALPAESIAETALPTATATAALDQTVEAPSTASANPSGISTTEETRQTAPSILPDSLLLPPDEADLQAVIPDFQIAT